ncbi:ATP-binding protein [Pantanalinema sp. GBBB05]|uniref:ATP-binding protein n=1 Tax=Pantanalinema sp. GBBB05 TaxID=2604139 RepID=UPI003D819A90
MFPQSSDPGRSRHLNSFECLLHRMIDRIRQSLELPDILMTTVAEVRAFLSTDRVKIYQFQPDESGEVVAEAIYKNRLPPLLGCNFPAEDIPPEARELFLQARCRSIVNVVSRQIGVSPLESEAGTEDIRYRPVDPCHAEYLTAMGVQSSLVVPILDGDRLWGLLVSHHSTSYRITKQKLQVIQLVADQVSVAIAQSNLLAQARLRVAQEATINQIATLLHTNSEMRLQEALDHVVSALQGSGGRLYIASQSAYHTLQVVVSGSQPVLDQENSALSTDLSLEQHPDWSAWLEMEEPLNTDGGVWAIADIYQSVMPSNLIMAFLLVPVRSLLVVRLQYRQQLLGYLSIYRTAIDTERIWAGRVDLNDPRQLRPRQSFEMWRELKQDQPNPWTAANIELTTAIAYHFSTAIYESGLYQKVSALNKKLKRDIQRCKQAEIEISALNTELEQRVLERTAELQTANAELVRQVTEREQLLQQRQQAEARLESLSRQNELILNSAGEGIYGLDAQGNITFANPATAKMLGCEVEDLVGKPMHTCLKHSKSDKTPYLPSESPIFKTLREGSVQSQTEDLFARQDGTYFPVEYVSSPILEQDHITGAVVIFKDITARQLVEQMKDEFVSIVSHELRTPLTSIRSTLGLLASGWLKSYPEKSQRMLEIAFSNTNRLVRLINDILDIERIKFGKVTMEKRCCNAADLMMQSADAMRAMAEKAEINLSVTPLAVELLADPDRIIQTFTNLLSNAIKFSPNGSTVWLNAELQATEPSGQRESDIHSSAYVMFSVKDQGSGIPEDKLETIFDQFQQVDVSNSRSQGGTGLGLTICRGIVQQHGGHIWVESTLGEGSTFYFTLALNKPFV